MAILNQISVGDIMYYTLDAVPIHTAAKGSISIIPEYSVMYRNNDGGTTWIRLMCDDIYVHSYFVDNLTGRDTTEGSFTNLDTLGWVLGESNGFSLPTVGQITYTGTTDITLFTKLVGTIEADAKWQDYEIINAFNNTVQPMYQGGTGKATSKRVCIANSQVHTMVTNDYLNVGVRFTARESGGGAASRTYIPKHFSYTAEKINEVITIPTVLFTEDWESGDFTANPWTVVNDTTNQWVVGTAEATGGTNSVYVSSDGGTSATYVKTVADVSHFYIDFEFLSGYDTILMNFDWKCWGEDAAGAEQYDYGVVHITDTGTTPTANTELLPITQAVGAGNGRVGASTNLGKFNEGYGGSDTTWRNETIDLSSYIGSTKRVVFTWRDDASAGDDVPFVVDNIVITGYNNL